MKSKAFTIIELIIAITVIAIIAVALAPLVTLGPNKLPGAASKLMYDIRYAQQLAINQQASYCGISFNPSGNNYFVYIGNTSTLAKDPVTNDDLLVDYDADSGYAGVELISTNFDDQLSFNYIGTPRDGMGLDLSSQGIITLQYGSHTQTITIEPNTGEVKVL
jgi:prepilin-type N-terminal cleavage/methylation domain-containing protein